MKQLTFILAMFLSVIRLQADEVKTKSPKGDFTITSEEAKSLYSKSVTQLGSILSVLSTKNERN